jgi:hypothetical protein
MPSLTDVANEIKAILNNVATSTQQTAVTTNQIKGDTAAANVKLDTINTTLTAGFATLGLGLFALHEGQKKTNTLLELNAEQNYSIICWLANIADVLCRMMRKMNQQTAIQTEMRDSLDVMRAILELVHAREFVEAQRLAEAHAAIEKCCPPPVEDPEYCFEPCALRPVDIYEPRGQTWKPPRQPAGSPDIR